MLTPTWSAPPNLSRDVSDGETLTASAWKGLPLGESGFVTIAAEYKDQEHTERGGWDFAPAVPAAAGNVFDPREATFNRFNSWYGEPELDQKTVFVNAGYDFASRRAHVRLGELAGPRREVRPASIASPTIRRTATSSRSIPNGFLPFIAPEVTDYSAAYGVRWKLGEWDMDSSLVYGKNKMEFTIENTLNRSLGAASPTVFDAGGFDYDQIVLNLSGVRGVEVGAFSSPLNVAVGIEARREEYSIFAGEPDSYRNGGVLLERPADSVGRAGVRGLPAGERRQRGPHRRRRLRRPGSERHRASSWPRSRCAASTTRTSARTCPASSRGATTSRRASPCARRCRTASARRRCSSSSSQTTSTNFISGVPFEVTTFPATDPVAVALGAKQLDAEESLNYSIGAVIRLGEVDITIDAYRIDIDDRIVLSENLTSAAVRDVPHQPGLHRRGRRALLHQRRRHADPGRGRGRELADRDRRRPLRLHVHRRTSTRPR